MGAHFSIATAIVLIFSIFIKSAELIQERTQLLEHFTGAQVDLYFLFFAAYHESDDTGAQIAHTIRTLPTEQRTFTHQIQDLVEGLRQRLSTNARHATFTPLVSALLNGNFKTAFELYCGGGAPLDFVIEGNKTLLDVVFEVAHTNPDAKMVLLTLLEYGAHQTPLSALEATIYNEAHRLHELLAQGEDSNMHDTRGRTLLMLAIRTALVGAGTYSVANPYESTFGILLAHNKTIEVNTPDRGGKTALMYAIMQQAPDSARQEDIIMRLTLIPRCIIDLQDDQGKTALIHAIEKHCSDRIIAVLLARGANQKLQDKRGNSALSLAQDWEYDAQTPAEKELPRRILGLMRLYELPHQSAEYTPPSRWVRLRAFALRALLHTIPCIVRARVWQRKS